MKLDIGTHAVVLGFFDVFCYLFQIAAKKIWLPYPKPHLRCLRSRKTKPSGRSLKVRYNYGFSVIVKVVRYRL